MVAKGDADSRHATARAAPEPRKPPSSILFICGMNSVRSPIAEAIARDLLGPSTYVASAGVRPGTRDPFVDAVLEEIGLKIARNRPQTLDELEDDFFDEIVTLAPEAHHRALDLTRTNAAEVTYWPMPDPTVATGTRNQILDSYRGVRDRIATMLKQRYPTAERS